MPAPYDPKIAVNGAGAPLVLVPGIDGTGRLFYRQVPGLARRHRTATYTLRDDATSMDELVEDLAGVIRTVSSGNASAVVIGESFGGTVALSCALTHPQLVRALVVLNSFPCFEARPSLKLAIAALRVLPWRAMPLLRRITAFRLHSRATEHEEIGRYLDLTRDTRREGYITRLGLLERYDIRARLSELRLPVLVLAAERDHLVPSVRQARYMAGRITGATLRILEGHGHICLIAPDVDLARLIQEWRADL
jgi:pimeloyl-ACP methyl ester carboxylesterase